jgi:hypothetical protein
VQQNQFPDDGRNEYLLCRLDRQGAGQLQQARARGLSGRGRIPFWNQKKLTPTFPGRELFQTKKAAFSSKLQICSGITACFAGINSQGASIYLKILVAHLFCFATFPRS